MVYFPLLYCDRSQHYQTIHCPNQGSSSTQLLVTFSFPVFKLSLRASSRSLRFLLTLVETLQAFISNLFKALSAPSYLPKPMLYALIFSYGTIPYPGPKIYRDYLLLCNKPQQNRATYNNKHFTTAQYFSTSEIWGGSSWVVFTRGSKVIVIRWWLKLQQGRGGAEAGGGVCGIILCSQGPSTWFLHMD